MLEAFFAFLATAALAIVAFIASVLWLLQVEPNSGYMALAAVVLIVIWAVFYTAFRKIIGESK